MSFPKKKIAFVAGAIIVLAGTNAATYYVTDKEATKNTPKILSTPEPVAAPKLENGSMSPHDVAIAPYQYVDKQISVTGIIATSGNNTYSIVDTRPDKPLGLRLDPNGKDADIKQYSASAQAPSDQQQEIVPVTVTGTVKNTKNADGTSTYALVVDSIKK